MSVEMSTAMPKYEFYKDSGTDWFGYIPAHWELKRLKFVDTVKMGQSPDSNDCNDLEMGLPFLQGNAEFGLEHPTPRLWCIRPKKISSKGDLLFSVRAPVGAINRSDQNYCIGRGLAAITVHSSQKALRKFQLLASVESFKKLLTGSTFEAISTDDLKNLLLCIPNEGETALITSFLDKKTTQIDEAIAIKEQQIALLKERKQIIIQKAVTQGLDPTVPMKDSGVDWIGEIPESWGVESVKNILLERNQKNDPVKSRERLSLSIDKGITLYSEKTTNLDRFKDDFSQYKLTHKGDLVFNSMNMIVGAVGVSDYFGCVSPVYYTFYAPQNETGVTKYYEHFFKSRLVQSQLYCLGKGIMAIDRGDGKFNTVRLKVARGDLRSMKVPCPPISEIREIVLFIEQEHSKTDEAIELQEQQIDKLKEYKTTLINSAVTGKIRITPEMVEA